MEFIKKENQHIRLFIVGDSTAQTYTEAMLPQAGWGQLLPLFFDVNVEILNRAIAGRSLKSYYNEGRFSKLLDEARAGDYCIIQFGHNDGAKEKPERYISYPDFENMLENEYIMPALNKGMFPITASHTQVSEFDEKLGIIPEPNEDISYPLLLKKVALAHNLPFLDINTLSRRLENEFGPIESKKLHMNVEAGIYERFPNGVKDTTHFSYYGAFCIAKLVADELSKIPEFKKHRVI